MKRQTLRFPLLALAFLLVISGCTKDPEEKEDLTANNYLSLGASANDLLSDENFTSLRIQVVYVAGHEPSASALENIKSFLQTYIHKPDGIFIEETAISSPGGGPYSIEEIAKLEKEHRIAYNSGDELAVYIFFADGRSAKEEENKIVLGTAYRNTSMVIFEESIRDFSAQTSLVTKSEITTTTLQHEFGHLFGLVDNGSPAQTAHQDSESKSHCDVAGCLMVASVQFGKGAVEHIKSKGSLANQLDHKCHQDLMANGGK